MKEVVAYLSKSRVQYFATMGLDGKPKVRPFQFMFEEGSKLWFCASIAEIGEAPVIYH